MASVQRDLDRDGQLVHLSNCTLEFLFTGQRNFYLFFQNRLCGSFGLERRRRKRIDRMQRIIFRGGKTKVFSSLFRQGPFCHETPSCTVPTQY